MTVPTRSSTRMKSPQSMVSKIRSLMMAASD